jgi:cardiolipin synthase
VATSEDEDRILTLPNAFTVIRLLCVPVFVYLLLIHHPRLRYDAAWLLAALGCTDWVDGYLARHLHQVSNVGKILDPVADRLLLIAGIVAAATIALAMLGARRIDVTWWGKAGTFGLMVAFPLFLVGHSSAGWHRLGEDAAWVAAIPGLLFGIYALLLYVPLARRALRDGRADRAAARRSPLEATAS